MFLKEHQGGDITFTLSNEKANDGKSTNTNSSVNIFTENVPVSINLQGKNSRIQNTKCDRIYVGCHMLWKTYKLFGKPIC